MRVYKVNRIDNRVYDSDDTLPEGLIVLSDQRDGQVGDWVQTDDDCVMQILRRGKMLRRMGKVKVKSYVGTCTGTFPVSPNTYMDTSKRDDIYSFGGRKAKDRIANNKNLTSCENKFVVLMASGIPVEEAYLQAYPTNNRKYAFVLPDVGCPPSPIPLYQRGCPLLYQGYRDIQGYIGIYIYINMEKSKNQ